MENNSLRIPRTLVVDISSNFGGANARILALIKKFPVADIGLATIEGSLIAVELEKLGYSVHRLATRKFDPRIPFYLARVIRDNQYEVLDTQNPQSKLWGSIAALLTRTALVSTLNSFYMNEHPKFSMRWFVYSILEFITNFSLSRYIVVSREIQTALVRMKIPQEKIDLISNAIDLDSTSISGDKKWLLKKFQLPLQAIICLAAGRLVWAKAHDDLIRAVAKARIQNPHIYCLIAGEGDLNQELIKLTKQLQLEKYILIPGHIDHDELLSCLKACDIYVMPSRTEGTPVALLEAAVLGKPIVASNVGGIPELVINEKHALLVEPGNIDSLAGALLRLIADVNLATSLGKQAKTWVEENFSLARQAQASAESYRKAYQNDE